MPRSRDPQYLSWLACELRPHLGDTVLEIGAGIGNISSRLMGKRLLYVAAEKNPLHLHALRNRFLRTPNVMVQQIDPEVPGDMTGMTENFDTVLCLNVLEYLDDPAGLVDSLRPTLKNQGALVVLVPNSPALFGSLDRSLGHKRRYNPAQMRELLESHGFSVQRVYPLNKAGAPPWLAYSRLFGARRINKFILKVFDKTVWFWSRIDRLLPWPGLSLIVVAHKRVVSAPRGTMETPGRQELCTEG